MGSCSSGMRGCCGHDVHAGEYELGDNGRDSYHFLSITNKPTNNDALVQHIRSVSSVAPRMTTDDLAQKITQLEEIAGYAPLLRLKVILMRL